ncbi:MAG: hypothetical protein AAGP08_14905 [Pseudomonadota bacterium]
MIRACLFFFALAVGLSMGPLAAHDGHDLSKISVETHVAEQTPGGVTVALTLINERIGAIELVAVHSDLGPVLFDPLSLAQGAAGQTRVTIKTEAMPGIFTLVLDFGEAGYGPITVIPL